MWKENDDEYKKGSDSSEKLCNFIIKYIKVDVKDCRE